VATRTQRCGGQSSQLATTTLPRLFSVVCRVRNSWRSRISTREGAVASEVSCPSSRRSARKANELSYSAAQCGQFPQVFTSAGEFKSPGVEIPIKPRDGKFFAIHFHFSHKFSNSRHSPASVLRAAFPVSPTITRVPGATWNAPVPIGHSSACGGPLRSSFLPTRKEPRFRETPAATTTPRSAPVRAALEFPPSAPVWRSSATVQAPLFLPRCSLLRAKTRAANRSRCFITRFRAISIKKRSQRAACRVVFFRLAYQCHENVLHNFPRLAPGMARHAQRKTIDLRLIAPVKLREGFFIAPGRGAFSRTSSLSCSSMCISPDVDACLIQLFPGGAEKVPGADVCCLARPVCASGSTLNQTPSKG